MNLSRRQLLVGSALLSVILVQGSRADGGATIAIIAAAMALASAVLDSMKKSGDIEREFEAINIKLDQILQNQIFIINAISALAKDVKTMMDLLADTPARVAAFDRMVEAKSLLNFAADTYADLKENPGSEKLKDEWRELQKTLYDLSVHLDSVAHNSDKPIDLVIAGDACVQLLRSFVLIGSNDEHGRRRFERTRVYLQNTISAMVGEDGIDRHLPPVRKRIDENKALIDADPMRGILPDNFDVVTKHHKGLPLARSQALVCLGSQHIALGGPRTGFRVYTMRDAIFNVETATAFGGRRMYQFTIAPTADWPSDSYRLHASLMGPMPGTEQAAKAKIYEKCQKLSYDKDGVPTEALNAFLQKLADYDLNVAWESRLLALKATAMANLDQLEAVKASLKKGE